MFEGIEAVAFDIDGTLYPQWALYIRMPFYILKNFGFYRYFRKVRHVMHRTAPLADFYEYQARIYAEASGVDLETARRDIDQISYRGLEKFFKKIKPFPHAREAIEQMKAAGLKIGILSDFPPDQKGDIWGIRPLADVCMGSEDAGALKPSKYPFGVLAHKLGVPAEKILYVGNSVFCDVRGAHNAGMKTAYILTGIKKLFNKKLPEADISFRNYRELQDMVLNGSAIK
ncbi:MAG: HAD family hydrolase [Treponema sp.]|nr:HAD family hydrolase [Treponema sp.]